MQPSIHLLCAVYTFCSICLVSSGTSNLVDSPSSLTSAGTTLAMPSAKPLLPLDPPQPWTKPTSANTNGGKTYAPTHSDMFRVEFSSSTSSNSSDEETYSSRLVAVKVSLTSCSLVLTLKASADARIRILSPTVSSRISRMLRWHLRKHILPFSSAPVLETISS